MPRTFHRRRLPHRLDRLSAIRRCHRGRGESRQAMTATVERLSVNATRTFLAVLGLERDRQSVTVTAIAATTGQSRSTAWHHLLTLRKAGLVAWEPRTEGTMRSLYRPVTTN